MEQETMRYMEYQKKILIIQSKATAYFDEHVEANNQSGSSNNLRAEQKKVLSDFSLRRLQNPFFRARYQLLFHSKHSYNR